MNLPNDCKSHLLKKPTLPPAKGRRTSMDSMASEAAPVQAPRLSSFHLMCGIGCLACAPILRLYSHNLAYKGLWWFFSRIIEAALHLDTPIGSFLEAWLGVIHGVWGHYGGSGLQYPCMLTSSQHASTQNSMKSF